MIQKVVKKFNKLMTFEIRSSESADVSTNNESSKFTHLTFMNVSKIIMIQQKSVDIYATIYRQTYNRLAYGELKFGKVDEHQSKYTYIKLGMKVGNYLDSM